MVEETQRALILQGGGALGAYEAGAVQELIKELSKPSSGNRPIFDIVAGTSSGAINAALMVSHIIERQIGCQDMGRSY
jgi:predicted acylesterase/phospholipase RssA